MKKIARFLLFIIFLLPTSTPAQVGIGTLVPGPSAILELKSDKQGLLIPRMATSHRNNILSPAQGLLIYNTTTLSFNFFDTTWKDLSGKIYSSNSTTNSSTTTLSNEIVTEMTITPPLSGKYKISFNGCYQNAPVTRQSYSTEQIKNSLKVVFDGLKALPSTIINHGVVFGNAVGEVLFPGVYDIAGAISTAGTIIFDGQGDYNSLFVIRMSALFSSGSGTRMELRNGASANNIFWVISGTNASAMAADTQVKGNIITETGANSMAAGANLEGRLFSLTGAVNFSTGTGTIPIGQSVFPLGDLGFFFMFTSTGDVTNAGTSNLTGDIGTHVGAITDSQFSSPTVLNGNIIKQGQSTQLIVTPSIKFATATFGIYKDNELIRFSEKKLTSSANFNNISLQAITTILPNQSIHIKWKTDSEILLMGNRTLILTKLE